MVEIILEFFAGLFASTMHGALIVGGALSVVLGILWPSAILMIGGVVAMLSGYIIMKWTDRRDPS